MKEYNLNNRVVKFDESRNQILVVVKYDFFNEVNGGFIVWYDNSRVLVMNPMIEYIPAVNSSDWYTMINYDDIISCKDEITK